MLEELREKPRSDCSQINTIRLVKCVLFVDFLYLVLPDRLSLCITIQQLGLRIYKHEFHSYSSLSLLNKHVKRVLEVYKIVLGMYGNPRDYLKKAG